MAKAALLDVLRQTIGKYVKNLDPESLSVGVWSGKIELNSLELDVQSINAMLDKKAEETPNLAMPFKVISGRFESFQVDVPWAHITSRPVVLRAQGLSVMIEPLDRSSSQCFDDDGTFDDYSTRDMKRAAKQKELRDQQIEENNNYRLQSYALKKIALAAENDNENDSDTSTFASRLARRIMENIQIEISNVHASLRNEDGAAGVVFESLKLMTTDKEGKCVYIDRTVANSRNSSLSDEDLSFLYKMLQIEGFGIYLDEDEFENARKSLQSISEDGTNLIRDNSSVYSNRSLGHSYVLAPLSFQTQLRIADKTSCSNNAKYELRSSLSILSFLVTRKQVDIIRKVATVMSPSESEPTPLFSEYRPLLLVNGHAKEWWQYACRCIGRMSGRRLWIEFFQAYQKRKKYIPLFKRHSHSIKCSWVKPLNRNELDDLVSIEQDRSISIEGLMAWRSIADAQIDKEREKRRITEQETTSSMFSYVFGSRVARKPERNETEIDGEPAIVLSVEEMKELEEISKFDIVGNDIAKDALLYDLKFVLDALKIDLVGYELNHLALLDMGKVTIDFDATTDGAFTTSFDLYDLQVFDRTTPNSLFPSVLKKIESGSEAETNRALHIDLSKSSAGDQSLIVKMAEFQLVASKLMIKELQVFFQDSSNRSLGTKMTSNPMLRKSLSGSVDLFYDAKQDVSFRLSPDPEHVEDEIKANNSPEVREMLSNKLIEVWKKKSSSKVSWMVDIDVKAPIVLVPEECNSPEANVLVFDLGNLKLKYGKGSPSTVLKQWFNKYPRDSYNDDQLESGIIDVNDLTFSVQRASVWGSMYAESADKYAIIEPIGVVIDFAVEDIGPDFEPRSCFFGVIPSISLRLSHVQGSQILVVINTWAEMFVGQGEDIHEQYDVKPLKSSVKHDSGDSRSEQLKPAPLKQAMIGQKHMPDSILEESFPMVYCRVGLQRLTVVIMDEGQKQLEAHLVSVYASLLQSSDESSVIRLTMGWFWVLDWIVGSYARKQRLLIHSNLPRSPESFSKRNQYNVIEELKKKGVFERHYSGSTELADVSLKTLSRSDASLASHKIEHKNSKESIKSNEIRGILDAKFRSLVVHWNPHAIKEINALLTRFWDVLAYDDPIDANDTLILTEVKSQTSRTKSSRKTSHKKEIEASDTLLIIAEMESLGVVLNSARDDLPIFMLTVSATRLSIIPHTVGQEISLSLGDLKVATPEDSGKTLSDYRTLLGLEYGSSGSLLTVKYCEGCEVIETLNLQLAGMENIEAVAVIELSPMRFCYIQSQVMTLSTYITDGILGALTAKAAISAAEAAKELANSVSGHYFFTVRATSFEAIIPEAAYRDENMRLKTASLNVDYYMYSDTRGSDIKVALSNLVIKGNSQKVLQESPIHLSIDVKMPMIGVGTLDDQAMRVNAAISEARFVLTQAQYSQIMNTLERNFSETALFLREDDLSGQIMTSAKETHSGVQLDESTQRIYFILDIKEVSLVLNGCDRSDPLVRLTATETTISMDMISDLDRFSMKALLQNLVCEDCRMVALNRQSRFLIDRSKWTDDTESKDIFQVKYCQENTTTNIDLTLGSPQLVLIPDLISEVLLFIGGSESRRDDEIETSASLEGQENLLMNKKVDKVDSIDGEEIIETNLNSSKTSITTISAQTGTCRFVLVDLGNHSTINKQTKDHAKTLDSRPELTEIVVLQGKFTGSLSMESILDSGKMQAANFQFNSDAMEIFTAFGKEMKSPLQILEPASASIHGSLKSSFVKDTEVEVRAAALTPIGFSLSIHNAALLMAIIDSVNDSFKYNEENKADQVEKEPYCLTPKEKERIEKLATALEKMEDIESFAYNNSGTRVADSRGSLSQRASEGDLIMRTKVQINVTMPQARITFINDLQGMDEALFRISVTNFVAGGNLTSPATLFDFYCNTSILADYFDSSVNLWSRLLLKSWEITMKGSRAPSHRCKSNRLSTTFDLESFPCWISFSEQFLVSLASAARMWSIYCAAANGVIDKDPEGKNLNGQNRNVARNLNLITPFPNAVCNHSGIDVSFSLRSGSINRRVCRTECTHFFRFDPPNGDGYGGLRVYGQDVEVPKIVEIEVEGTVIIVNMDLQLGLPAHAHEIGDKLFMFTQVIKDKKTTVLYLMSQFEVTNRTLVPFNIEFVYNGESFGIGKCDAKNSERECSATNSSTDGLSKRANNFSIPIPLLANFQRDWQKYGQGTISLRLIPLTNESDNFGDTIGLVGEISTLVSVQEMRRVPFERLKSKVEVTCRAKEHPERGVHPLTLNVVFTTTLIGGEHALIEASLEPRSIIENRMPLAMKIRTLMPQTFSICLKEESVTETETTYCVHPNERIEIFTPGPSIAITTRTRDNPIAGLDLGWVAGWVDLPMIDEFRLQDPIVGILPLETRNLITMDRAEPNRETGAEIFIVEGKERLNTISDVGSEKLRNLSSNPPFKSTPKMPQKNDTETSPLLFILTVCSYGVDHTGSILFEQAPENEGMQSSWRSHNSLRINESRRFKESSLLDEFSENRNKAGNKNAGRLQRAAVPLGAFSSPVHRRRISLLPNTQCPIRLHQMTIEGEEGFRRTMPFMIEHLPIGDGGAASMPIVWENKKQTGLFAYRHLVNGHQSEIHIIPEFIVFNGSDNTILVKEEIVPEMIIESGDIGQLRAIARPNGLKLSINFIELNCRTAPLSVSKLGLKVAIVESNKGIAVGSVYIQTVIDTRGDSRLVIKVGEVRNGSHLSPVIKEKGSFDEDYIRFRVRWTELQLVLNEVGQRNRESWDVKNRRTHQDISLTANRDGSPASGKTRAPSIAAFKQDPKKKSVDRKNLTTKQPIMAMIFSRFTVDFQRVFKDGEHNQLITPEGSSPQRSQISVIVHNIQIKDLTSNSHYPMVFDCTSDKSVFDLCIRVRGPLSAELVKVDLFDLNLAHAKGNSEKMTLTTSEDYLWRILDLVNRILAASGEVAGFTIKYENDDDDKYTIKIEDAGVKSGPKPSEKHQYSIPAADILYDIALARVSPFTIVVSFRRSPELARYKKVHDAPGAAVTNYFTRKLKFTIEKAELNFTRYEDRTLKGPSDRLIEALSTVYIGRMKFKFVSLLSAASLQDWRFLAARDDGDDEYVEGDILRATGNLAGKSAGLVIKTVGRGLGGAVAGVSSFVGEGIENGTSKIGARRFGSGVSSVVTGMGHGVGDTVSGVGTGASKFLQGAGQGVGHVFGGVSGGALQIGKGIGKGIATGDGRAVVEGISKGASSVGGGIAQGAESAVMGTADGLLSAGKGIFHGFRSVGHGIGGAIRGKKPSRFERKKKDQEQK